MTRCGYMLPVVILAVVLLTGITAPADTTYHTYEGQLIATPADGSGIWVNDPGGYADWEPAKIEWWITETGAGFYHYKYEISVYRGDVSDFILETSEPLPEGDIWDIYGDHTDVEIGYFSFDEPYSLYGVKFEDNAGTTFTVEFTSNRLPVWGDFYAKDGQAGGEGLNQFWNAGFLLDDPLLFPPTDGSRAGHILRPDSYIPEPSTMAMLALGLMTLGAAVRRRRGND